MQSEKQPRLYALDAMRGICALALMFYHFYSWNGVDYFQIGYFGVYVFFILSGFSMWYVYANKPHTLDTMRHFFVARVARIVPLYVLACLLSVGARIYSQGIEGITNAAFVERFLFNITMLFGVAMPGKASIVPGGWSIGIEWVFYLVFPLCLMFGRNLKAMLMLLAGSLVLNQVIVGSLLSEAVMASQWNYYTQFPTFIMYFAGGMVVAQVYEKFMHRRNGGRKLPFPDSVWLCRMVPVFSIAVLFLYPSASAEDYLRGPHVALLLLVAMGGVLMAAFARPGRLEQKLYRFLGDISYSTYLLNFFVYSVVNAVLGYVWPGHPFGVTVVVAGAGSIAAAYCSYRFFEMPARRWINKKLG